MKIMDMSCPKCGAPLQVNADKEQAVCEYCGYNVLIEKEDTIEEIRQKAQSKSYGYHKGKLEAEAEVRRKQKLTKVVTTVIVMAVIIAIISIFAGIGFLSKQKVNPFEHIKVSFEGTDGDGELIMETNAAAGIDYNYIDFDISKDDNLYQGEQITITATSVDYRLTESTKVYTVEGLDEYLKDPNDISQETLELIHTKAEAGLDFDFDIFMYMEPVKLFLLTDGKQTNTLFDVFGVHFMTQNGEQVYYVPARFEDVVVREGGQISLGTNGMSSGHLIQVEGWRWIFGYNSIDEIRADILTGQESYMELKELDLTTEEVSE